MERQLTDEEREAQALSWAYAHVNRRERTVAEVRAHLERKGVSESTVDAALRELVETHLVDDERYATMYVADKRGLEQWGTERIRRGLRERGLERELVERALAETADAGTTGAGTTGTGRTAADLTDADTGFAHPGEQPPTSELERALLLLRRRFPAPPRDRRERDRALGMLLRKGYESELACDALAAYARGD